MKNICMITPLILPVPNVKGGAIETLITNLIDCNEEEQKIKLTVFSIYDEDAKKISEKYKNVEIIFIKKTLITKLLNFVFRVYRKIKNNKNVISYYYQKVFYMISKMDKKFDFIIAEGGEERYFKYLIDKCNYKKEQLIMHIHSHRFANIELENIFGKYIVVSNFIKKEWLKSSVYVKDEDVLVLKNSIDQKKFDILIAEKEKNKIRNNLKFDEKDFIVIFCGRIIKEKGVHELLNSIKMISDHNVKLLIVGSPQFALNLKSEYLEQTLNMIEKINDRVKFTGYIDNSQLYKYYQLADIMVIPSIWEEAAGLVAIEGMISKLPLIITESGGMVEYVTDECAIKIKRDENISRNLANSIIKLKNDKTLILKMKEESYKTAQLYRKETFFYDFCKIIEEIK